MRANRPLVFTALAACMLCSAQTSSHHSTSARSKAAASSTPKPIAGIPNIILFNGVIYTGVGFAEDKPQIVEAIAIGGGKVIAIGNTEQIKRLAGSKTA